MPDLTYEILFGTLSGVAQCIQSGVDLNQRDVYGYTPLQEAAIAENVDAAALLLQHKEVLVDQEDMLGLTALQWAADNHTLPLCELLLQHGANPNHYTVDGQPILVTPLLRGQQDLVDLLTHHGAHAQFAWDFIYAKLLGHRFELVGQGDIVNAAGKFVGIALEGFYLEFTVGILQHTLIAYLSHIKASTLFEKYWTALGKIIRVFNIAAQLVRYKFNKKQGDPKSIRALLNDDLLVIPVAYQGHAITFVRYRNLFAKCDRGVNHMTDTVVIYEVRHPYVLTPDFLMDLMFEPKKEDYINTEIKKILGLRAIATLPTRYQLSGNCSWANVEASVPACLFMLYFQGDIYNRSAIAALRQSAMAVYGSWVDWDKDRLLDKFIEDFYASDKVSRAAKAALLGSIVIQRCDYQKKEEVSRAKKIVPIVALPDYSYLLKNYVALYGSARTGQIGKRITHLLKICGVNLSNMTLNLPLHVAVKAGQLSAVKYLLDTATVAVDQLDSSGSTALLYAAWLGHFEIVRCLIEVYKANPRILNRKGGTALRYAMHGKQETIVRYLQTL